MRKLIPKSRSPTCWSLQLLPAVMLFAALAISPAYAASDAAPIRTLYLVRHGSYVPDPKASPEAGPSLTALGIAQARLVGARLRAMPVNFASITSSTMTRARETAAVIHEQMPTVPASSSVLLSECTPPARVELRGETEASMNACRQRLDEAFAKFAAPATGSDKNDVLVCHGTVIRYFVAKALGVDTRVWPGMSVAHASVTLIEVAASGAFRVIAVGDQGHVPPSLQSWGTAEDPQLLTPDTRRFPARP